MLRLTVYVYRCCSQVRFGNQLVEAEVLCPWVLRCFSPASPGAGQVPLSIVNDLDQPVTNEVPEVTFTWTGDSRQLVRSQSSQMLMSPLASARSRSGDSGISRILRGMSSDSGDGGDLRRDHSIPRLRSLSDDFDQHVYQRQVMYLQQEDLQVKKDTKQYEKSALRLSSSTTGSGIISPRLPHEDTFDHLSLGEPFLKDVGVANYFSGYSGNKKRMVEHSSGLNVHFEPFSASSHSLDPDHHPLVPPLPLESANVDERIERWLQQLDPHISCDEAILPTASKDEMIEGHQESITQLIHMITQDEELLADIDSLDSNGYNLLHYCCIYNLYKLLEVLLAKKADPNRLSNTAHGMSSGLHLAVKGNASVQLVQMLIQHNAILNLHDSQNRTPYDLAVAYKRTALMDYFKNHINFTQHNHTSLASRSPPLPPISPFYTGTSNAPPLQRATSDDDKMISTQVFHEVFQNLTITEKCALALSMSPRISDSPKHHGLSPTGKNKHNIHNNSNNNNNISHQRQSSSTFSFISAPSPLVDDSVSSPFDSQSRILGASSGNRLSSSGSPVKNILRKSDFYQYSVIDEEGLNYDHPNNASNNDEDGDDASTITDVDLKSVISRRDLDHLQSAMQLMGETELKEVESEVRNIQKNVRGWLLRKNYNSLRASALTLQSAWRERKRHQQGLKSSSNEMSASLSDLHNPGSSSHAHTPNLEDTLSYEYNEMQELADALLAEDSTMNIDEGGGQQTGVLAHNYYDPSALSPGHHPSTLGSFSNDALTASTTDNNNHYPSTDTASVSQSAATRGMNSRSAFASVRQQAIASLVIQKSLRSWWGKQRQTGDQTGQPHLSAAPPSSTAYIGGTSGKSLGGQELDRQDSGTTVSQSRSNKRPYDRR